MSDNVGLSTPRGSGTSGYVQRNRAFIRPRDNAYAAPSNPREALAAHQKQQLSNRPREPDQGILEHDRKRAIEVRVFELRDELEEKGELDEDAIDERCDELRKKLTEEAQRNNSNQNNNNNNNNGRQRFKAHQVHEQARAKQIESERLRRALRINKDYEEGGHWRRQEEKQNLSLKRKQEEGAEASRRPADPEPRGRDSPKRRRRYSDSSDRSDRSVVSAKSDRSNRSDKSGYSSYEEGEISRSKGRRSPQPPNTAEKSSGRGRRRSRSRSDSRSPPPRARSASDSRSRSYSRSPSRTPSRSPGGDKAAARQRSPSHSRSPGRSPSRSPSRSRSASRD